MQNPIAESTLMLAEDGSVFHLRLRPEWLTSTVILVGDPGRVQLVLGHLQQAELLAANREFHSGAGCYHGQRVLVVSHGIGAGCIDIVVNELDALANVDLSTRTLRAQPRQLRLVRLGTSGAVQPDLEPGNPIVSLVTAGFDTVPLLYRDSEAVRDALLERVLQEALGCAHWGIAPYAVPSSPGLHGCLPAGWARGITLTMPGFFGPQGRQLRLPPILENLLASSTQLIYNSLRILNMEMEAAPLNALARMLGHESITVALAINNRAQGVAKVDYQAAMEKMVEGVLRALI